MRANKFYSILINKITGRNDISLKNYKLKYKKGSYNFLRISSKKISSPDKVVLICAGIHGDEIAGPLTILNFINKIIDYIHNSGLKCIIYPLTNPSGFENNLRYNIDNDRGTVGNNDFVRYELKSGSIVDDLVNRRENDFKKWSWSSDKKLAVKLPKETALMHKLLKKDVKNKIVATIDLHQDCITKAPPAAYHYAFGKLSLYKNITKQIEKLVPIYRNKSIGAGESSFIRSDKNGFIVRHDGSLPDLFYRNGVKHCITVETTGKTPQKIAQKVNLIWIFGVVDIIKNST